VARGEAEALAVDLVLGEVARDADDGFRAAARALEETLADAGDVLAVGDAEDGVDVVEALRELGPVPLGRQPATTTALRSPFSFNATMRSIVSMDSRSLAWRNPQVLTTTTSLSA